MILAPRVVAVTSLHPDHLNWHGDLDTYYRDKLAIATLPGAEVTVSNAERAVLPQTAVLHDDKGSYVLVVNNQGKVERKSVRVTGMVATGVTIAEGLNPKDQIVTSAGAFLQEGETVKPVLIAAGKS